MNEFLRKGKTEGIQYLILFLLCLGLFVILQGLIPLISGGTDVQSIVGNLFSKYEAWQALAVLLLPFLLVLVLTALFYRLICKEKPAYLLRRDRPVNWGYFFRATIACVLVQGLFLFTDALIFPENYEWQGMQNSWPAYAAMGLVGYAWQALAEEILFRTLLMRMIYAFVPNAWASMIVSSLLFGSMHLGNPEVQAMGLGYMSVMYFSSGLLLSWFIYRSGGLEFAWAFHWVNNWIGSVVVTYASSAVPGPSLWKCREPEPSWMLLFTLLQFAVMLLIFKLFFTSRRNS